MTADKETERIEKVRELLHAKLDNTNSETAFFSFAELTKEPLLADATGREKVLNRIAQGTEGRISWLTRTESRWEDNNYQSTADSTHRPPELVSALTGIEIHVSDPEKIDEYLGSLINPPIRLSEHKIDFNDAEATVIVANRKSWIPQALNEHLLCRVMFDAPVRTAVDWSVIYEKMTGNDPHRKGSKSKSRSAAKEIEAHTRMVRDAMHAANTRLQHDLNTKDELFLWENKSVIRQF